MNKLLIPVLLMLVVCVGCGTGGPISITTQPPVIDSFDASPPTIAAGESSTLSWKVSGAATASIDQGIGNVAMTGTRVVSPSTTTIYTLTATSSTGASATATAQVIVSGASAPSSLPVVNSFIASPASITAGGLATLNWNVANATSVTIEPGLGSFASSGNVIVSPVGTTTYILTATNAAGSTTSSALVTVSGSPAPPVGLPVVSYFTANPPIITAGGSTTLSWSVSNATSVTIDHGVGTVDLAGTTLVSPATSTNYTLAATNASGTYYLTIQVLVTASPTPIEHTVTLYSVAAEDGHVKQSGATNPYPNLGDNTANEALQAFLSFDISGIPSDAVIKSASLDLTTGDMLDDPFAGLGWMRVYNHQYGSVGPEDFTAGFPTGAIYTYSSRPLTPFSSSGLVNALQALVNAGEPRFQVRIQFQNYSDGDNTVDALRLGEGDPKLVITYEE